MSGSFLEELRAISKVAKAHEHKDIVVPGVAGRWWCGASRRTTRTPSRGTWARTRSTGTLSFDQQRQLLIDCRAEVMRRGEDGQVVQADPEGGPLRFDAGDERWGGDVKTARDCVSKLFSLDMLPLALAGELRPAHRLVAGHRPAIAARVEGKSGSTADSSETPPAST